MLRKCNYYFLLSFLFIIKANLKTMLLSALILRITYHIPPNKSAVGTINTAINIYCCQQLICTLLSLVCTIVLFVLCGNQMKKSPTTASAALLSPDCSLSPAGVSSSAMVSRGKAPHSMAVISIAAASMLCSSSAIPAAPVLVPVAMPVLPVYGSASGSVPLLTYTL